jgi:hypothetical protein
VTGAGGLNTIATSLTYTGDQVNAGTYYVTAHYAGDANHLESDGVAVAITISKATSTTTTGGAGPFVYDGTAHNGGSGTVTGAGGLNTSATSLTYTGDQVNAGTYYVIAHYAGDANHFGSDGAAVAIIIAKANATVVVTPYNVQWDGNPHTATYTITGVNLETGATVGAVTLKRRIPQWARITPTSGASRRLPTTTRLRAPRSPMSSRQPTASTDSCRPSVVRLKPRMAAASRIR